MGSRLWLDPSGTARVDRRGERESALDGVYEAYRLLQAYGGHSCPEPCERELQAVRRATQLLRS